MENVLGGLLRNKYKFLFSILFLAAALIGFIIYNSYAYLTIHYHGSNTGIRVGVYKVPAGSNYDSPDQAVNPDNLVKEISQNTKMKLKKGNYVVATYMTDDYQRQVNPINLGKTSQTLEINPSYSVKKLGALLEQELPSIKASINQSVSGLSSEYSVNTGKLYLSGDWYGTTIAAKLSPKQYKTQYVDVFRLVAYKDNGAWRVVTLPPALILSQVAYPSIPHEVLVDVNQMPQ